MPALLGNLPHRYPSLFERRAMVSSAASVQTTFLQMQRAPTAGRQHSLATPREVNSHHAWDEPTTGPASPVAQPLVALVLLLQRCRLRDTTGTSVCSDFHAQLLVGHLDGQRDRRERGCWLFRPPPSASPNGEHAVFPGNAGGVPQDRSHHRLALPAQGQHSPIASDSPVLPPYYRRAPLAAPL